ncbi:MAG: glucosamine-6-phosphate deaminase [Lachnospiraceae bacterium]|nr:glucosamine-6-phosphate deaminase [Candidatus Colinaster equi]
MRIIKTESYDAASRACANLIMAQIVTKPDCVLGLATGSTPIGTYENLVRMYKDGDISFAAVNSVNLDEYKGLSPENDQSYRYFMNDHLFSHVDIDIKKTNVPNGLEPDANKACEDYEEIIKKLGGIDLQLLGLGPNGHIGFNEPCDEFVKKTHCVDLTQSTIEANSRFFASMDEVPKQAYTMGIQTIMNARKVVLIATGKNKAETVKKAFFGPITPSVPASILQLHPDCTVVLDADAASLV